MKNNGLLNLELRFLLTLLLTGLLQFNGISEAYFTQRINMFSWINTNQLYYLYLLILAYNNVFSYINMPNSLHHKAVNNRCELSSRLLKGGTHLFPTNNKFSCSNITCKSLSRPGNEPRTLRSLVERASNWATWTRRKCLYVSLY